MEWWNLIEFNCADANSNSPHYGDKGPHGQLLLHTEHLSVKRLLCSQRFLSVNGDYTPEGEDGLPVIRLKSLCNGCNGCETCRQLRGVSAAV